MQAFLTVEQLFILTYAKIHQKENTKFKYDEAASLVDSVNIDDLLNRELLELIKIHQVPDNYFVLSLTEKGNSLLNKLLNQTQGA